MFNMFTITICMLTFADKHLAQSPAESDGRVVSFTIFGSLTKPLLFSMHPNDEMNVCT